MCARVSRTTLGGMLHKPFSCLLTSACCFHQPACRRGLKHCRCSAAKHISDCTLVAALWTGACAPLAAPHGVATCLQKQAGGCSHAAPVWQQPCCADGAGLLCLTGRAVALSHGAVESLLCSAVHLTLSSLACRSVQIWRCSVRQPRWRSCSWTDLLRCLHPGLHSSCCGAHRQFIGLMRQNTCPPCPSPGAA